MFVIAMAAIVVAGTSAYLYHSPLELTYVYNIYGKMMPNMSAKRIFVKLDKKTFALKWFISDLKSQSKQILGDWITKEYSAKSLTFSTKVVDLLSFSLRPFNIQVKDPYLELSNIKRTMRDKLSYVDFELLIGLVTNLEVDNGKIVANYKDAGKNKQYTLSKIAVSVDEQQAAECLNINVKAAVDSTSDLKINKVITSIKVVKQRGFLIAKGSVLCPHLPTKILLSLWPKSFKGNARLWSFTNIKNGKATNLKNSFTINIFRHKKKHKLWRVKDMILAFTLSECSVKYNKLLPALKVQSADLKVTSKELLIDNLVGSVLNQKISKAQGIVKETNNKGTIAIDLSASGKVQELLDGIVGELFPRVKTYLKVNGTMGYNLNMKVPFKPNLSLEDIKLKVKGAMDKVSVLRVGDIEDFNGNFKDISCTIEDNILLVSSPEGLIDGQVSDFVYQHFLTKDNHIEDVFAKLSANVSSNIAFYKKFGLNLRSIITGGGKNNLNLVFSKDKVDVKLAYDLTQSSIEVPYLKVSKPKDSKAIVRGRLIFSKGEFKELNNLNLTVDNSWVMTASGIHDGKDGWSYFKSDCQLANEKLFDFVVNTKPDGKQEIFLKTKELDIKKIVKSLREESLADINDDSASLLNPMKECLYNITADKFYSDKLYLGSGFEFIGTQKFVFTEINMTAYSRNNSALKEKDIYLKLKADGMKRKYELYMPEAGLLVQSMPQLRKVDIDGVKLSLTNDLKEYERGRELYKAGKLWAGSISLKKLVTPNFVNSFKRTKKQVSTLNSEEQQIAEIEATLQKKGYKKEKIVFSNNRVDFSYSSEADEITIKESIFSNAEIGISLEGIVNIGNQGVNLTGTFIPAYIINSLLGRIPIIGLFLRGKSKGVFALNFNVAGNFPNVETSVNKASIIAPGILRVLFPARKVSNSTNKGIN